jgi:hypothetical protein
MVANLASEQDYIFDTIQSFNWLADYIFDIIQLFEGGAASSVRCSALPAAG